MEALWRHGEGNVREVGARLGRPLAYTTVMTTLDRLYKKGLLDRRKQDRAFLYSPRYTHAQWQQKRAGEFLAGYLSGPETARRFVDLLPGGCGRRAGLRPARPAGAKDPPQADKSSLGGRPLVNLPYGARLASIAAASFFAVNLAAGAVSLALERGSPPPLGTAALRAAPPRSCWRCASAPGALALAAVAVLCVPSFLAAGAGGDQRIGEPGLPRHGDVWESRSPRAPRCGASPPGSRSRRRFPRLETQPRNRCGSRARRRIPVEIVDSRRPLLAHGWRGAAAGWWPRAPCCARSDPRN
jgi:hypothetical protein